MKRKRVLLIGLDGATYDLVKPWVEEGKLPNLASFLDKGSHGILTSTIQPTTAPAWVTIMTGVNQGKHGLFDFIRRRKGTYGLEVTNASYVQAPTLFDIVSQVDKKLVCINMPYTSPVRPVNGKMIGGPFAPALSKDVVYPPDFLDDLITRFPNYFILPDYDPNAVEPMRFYADKLLQSIDLREQVSLYMIENNDWDLFSVVFMETDEVQHAFWHCMNAEEDDPYFRYRNVIPMIYQRIDKAIGEIINRVEKDQDEFATDVIIISDHGAGPLHYMINLNRFLSDNGYLQFQQSKRGVVNKIRTNMVKKFVQNYRRLLPPELREKVRKNLGSRRFDSVKGNIETTLLTMNVEWDQTRAYSLGAGGNIYINLEGREPNGIVSLGKPYDNLCNELIRLIMGLKDPVTGQPIVAMVHKRADLYKGPFDVEGPDLIIEWKDYGYWGRGRYDSTAPVFEGKSYFEFTDLPLSGAHRPEGIFLVKGPQIRPGVLVDGAKLVDITPTILRLLSVQPLENMDGRILYEILLKGKEGDDNLETVEGIFDPKSGKFIYSSSDEETITQHLRSLGYL